MTERAAELGQRIQTVGELLQIVGAMRSLAATRAQQAAAGLSSIRAYAEVIEGALSGVVPQAGPRPAQRSGPRCVVAFGAEHGFVGAFNERLLDRAKAELLPGDLLAVVGTRCALTAAERGLHPEWWRPTTNSLRGAEDAARGVRIALEEGFASGGYSTVTVLFMRRAATGQLGVAQELLVPLDLDRFARERARAPAPLTYLSLTDLVERLAREYLLAELTRVVTESWAAENGARLQAMQLAHQRIEDRLGQLRRAQNASRQEEVTSELLDLISGVLASVPPAA